MKASLKKQIERNIQKLIAVGSRLKATDKENGETAGTITITYVSREEIRGNLEGTAFGWEGRETSFRVPELTQKGGNLRIEANTILALA
mgnify:CR=1 FL=1